jgi:alpha-glucoside transport system permease protein
VVPQIWATVITVFITVTIAVMKIFDVVYVMTNGNFNTDVVAVRFFNELFRNGNNGAAAAIVVMLMIAVLPIMIYQVRNFRAQEAAR